MLADVLTEERPLLPSILPSPTPAIALLPAPGLLPVPALLPVPPSNLKAAASLAVPAPPIAIPVLTAPQPPQPSSHNHHHWHVATSSPFPSTTTLAMAAPSEHGGGDAGVREEVVAYDGGDGGHEDHEAAGAAAAAPAPHPAPATERTSSGPVPYVSVRAPPRRAALLRVYVARAHVCPIHTTPFLQGGQVFCCMRCRHTANGKTCKCLVRSARIFF